MLRSLSARSGAEQARQQLKNHGVFPRWSPDWVELNAIQLCGGRS